MKHISEDVEGNTTGIFDDETGGASRGGCRVSLEKENERLRGDLAAMSNSYHATNKERLELKDKLDNERTISDCLAGAISGTFDYGDAVKRYNDSLESPRSGIPPVNIFTHGLGFQMHDEIVKLRTEINCRIEHGADNDIRK